MNYRVHLWSECLSPTTHMKGVEGNEAMLARQPIDTPSGKRWVPHLSGNMLRHVCVREPGGLWLIEQLGLRGQLSLLQLNFFLHGGNLTDSTGREDTTRIAQMQELFPQFRLLGGALPDQILRGSLQGWQAILVCEENRAFIPHNLPPDFLGCLPTSAWKPAEHYVESYQYTRGDAARCPDWYDPETHDPETKSNLMIFAGQQVIAGSAFSHGFNIPHGSFIEYGCLLHALGLWIAASGTVGGMASKGHGRLNVSIVGGNEKEMTAAIEAYTAHVAAHVEPCRAWLEKVFARKTERAAAKKKAGAANDV